MAIKGIYICKLDADGSPVHSRLMCVPEVWEEVFLFDSHKDLDDWLAWLETPSEKPKIISFTDKKRTH